MTTLQTLSLPHFDSEDVMELSTEGDPLEGSTNDVDVEIDLTENQFNGELDEDMREDFDDRLDRDISQDLDGFQEAGADASMEDDEIVGRTYITSIPNEVIQDTAATEADVDEDVIVDDLLEDVERAPLEQDKDTEATAQGEGHILGQSQENLVEDKNLTTEPDATDQANTRGDEYTDVPPVQSPKQRDHQDPGIFLGSQFEKKSDRGAEIPSNDREQILVMQANNAETSQQGLNDVLSTYTEVHTQDMNAALDKTPAEIINKLHQIFVIYQDTTMSLFPPMHNNMGFTQMFLLQDERLAAGNMRSLLVACRIVLEDSIGEDDELEIVVDELGLRITEVGSSKCSSLNHTTKCPQSTSVHSEITLLQLLDLYSRLHSNDGEDDIPPLYLHLLTKTSFSHRWVYLLNLANEGKGLSYARPILQYDQEDTNEDSNQGFGSGNEDTDTFRGENDNLTQAEETGQEMPLVGDVPTLEPKPSRLPNKVEPAPLSNTQENETHPDYQSTSLHNIQTDPYGVLDSSKQHAYATSDITRQEIAVVEHQFAQGELQGELDLNVEREDSINDEGIQDHRQDSSTNSSTLKSDTTSPKNITTNNATPTEPTGTASEAINYSDKAQETPFSLTRSQLSNDETMRELNYREPALDVADFHDNLEEESGREEASINGQEYTDQSESVSFDVRKEGNQQETSPPGVKDDHPLDQKFTGQEDDVDQIDEMLGRHEAVVDNQTQEAYQTETSEIDPQNYDITEVPRHDSSTREINTAEDQIESGSITQDNNDDISEVGEEEFIHAEQRDSNECKDQRHEPQLKDPESVSNSIQQYETESALGEDELYSEPLTKPRPGTLHMSSPRSLKRPHGQSEDGVIEEPNAQGKPLCLYQNMLLTISIDNKRIRSD